MPEYTIEVKYNLNYNNNPTASIILTTGADGKMPIEFTDGDVRVLSYQLHWCFGESNDLGQRQMKWTTSKPSWTELVEWVNNSLNDIHEGLSTAYENYLNKLGQQPRNFTQRTKLVNRSGHVVAHTKEVTHSEEEE